MVIYHRKRRLRMACPRNTMLRHGPLAMGWCATALTLCGLAALQSLCWSRDVVGTNSRKLLLDQEPVLDALVASCVKTYRFQWWGWALQLAYLAGATLHAARSSCTPAVGIHILGATATVLAMLFANDNLKAMDDAAGILFSRLTLTFVGFTLIALFNFLNFIGHDCVAQAACSQATAREQKINAGAGAAPEVLATSA
ncbi:hypothetical protein ACKKBF_B33215 [Auxenochlorella protothecoides x Auxenochlorella symbiontica]